MKKFAITVLLIFINFLMFGHDPLFLDSKKNGTTTYNTIRATNFIGSFIGDGSQLINLPVQPVLPISVPTTFYFAPRQDRKAGAGTFNDPFDVSTPDKLDATWKAILSTNLLGHKKIVFLPGTYYTINMLNTPSGINNLTLSGYGATIYATNHFLTSNWTMFGVGRSTNIIIEGFEMDCGLYVKPSPTNSVRTGAISVNGANHIIRNVTVRNLLSYPYTYNPESFGIIMMSENGICNNNTVLNVILPNGSGGVTAIVIMGRANTLNGNTVYLNENSRTNGVFSFAYTIYGSENTMVGNACQGVDVALSMDNGGNGELAGQTWRDNIIVGNQFISNDNPLRIDNTTQSYKDWTFVGNNFSPRENCAWVNICTWNQNYLSNKVTGFSFVGNRFTGTPRHYNNVVAINYDYHSFIGNMFSTNMNVSGSSNLVFGLGNMVKGKPDDTAFKLR